MVSRWLVGGRPTTYQPLFYGAACSRLPRISPPREMDYCNFYLPLHHTCVWLFCLTGTFSKTKPLKDVNRINSSNKLGEFSPDCIITHVGLPQNTQVCLVKTITATTTTKDNLCSFAMEKKKITPGRGSAGCRHNTSDSCTIDGHRETAFCFARGKSLNVTDRSAVAVDPPHLANPPPQSLSLIMTQVNQLLSHTVSYFSRAL